MKLPTNCYYSDRIITTYIHFCYYLLHCSLTSSLYNLNKFCLSLADILWCPHFLHLEATPYLFLYHVTIFNTVPRNMLTVSAILVTKAPASLPTAIPFCRSLRSAILHTNSTTATSTSTGLLLVHDSWYSYFAVLYNTRRSDLHTPQSDGRVIYF